MVTLRSDATDCDRYVPRVHKLKVIGLAAAAVMLAALFTPVLGTSAVTYQTITLATPLGSHHSYTGPVYCDGSFSATGTTAGTYTEAVVGTISATSLTFTSSYDNPVFDGQYGYG